MGKRQIAGVGGIDRNCGMDQEHRERRRGKLYRKIRLLFTGTVLLGAGIAGFYGYTMRQIPDKVSIVENREETMSLDLPFQVTLQSESEEVILGGNPAIPEDQITIIRNEPFQLKGKSQGNYQLGVDLFGMIRLKEIQVDVVETQYAIPCGTPVGIYLKADGVMVIGTGKVTGEDGETLEPAAGILKSGDYIEAINGKKLETKEQLATAVSELDGSEARLTVRRGEEHMEVAMDPVITEDGTGKLGIWVRSDTQGIGTMTYLDLNGRFGALGHGISDSDTGELVEISDGYLYDTRIVGIEKGSTGNPGVMSGVIYYGPGTMMGEITANTDQGIFGQVNQRLKSQITSEPIEIGFHQEVKKGKAYIRSGVSGEIKDYEIEIMKVDESNIQDNKSLVLQVTDPELLSLTGGIVQGMSGSPIIQNGKLIGAVTHVFVQDSAKGYGIFIEKMLGH